MAESFKLYSNPICPFAHRAWFLIEEKKLPHEFHLVPLSGEINQAEKLGIENVDQWKTSNIDDIKKQKEDYKAQINPTGEVPTIVMQNGQKIFESDIICEFLQQVYSQQGTLLLPEDPYKVAYMRFALKGFSNVVPLFYQLLSNQDPTKDQEIANKITAGLKSFVDKFQLINSQGPYFLGDQLSLVEVNIVPFLFRMKLLLSYYRKFELIPQNGENWTLTLQQFYDAITSLESFKKTSPSNELIIKAYESYAHGQKWEGNQLVGRGISIEFGK